jgi:DNA-binding beta-propeller fold protein YncE
VLVALCVATIPRPTYALISDGLNALDLVGQYDETSFTAPVPVYTKNLPNNGANKFGFNGPSSVKIDLVNNKLFVVDTNNNRILIYNLNSTGSLLDRVPDSVLGQTTFWGNTSATSVGGLSSPTDVHVGITPLTSRFFISDTGNNRVLGYDYGLSPGQNAFDAIGQYDETSISAPVPIYTKATVNNAPNRLGLSSPTGLTFDDANDRLFVGDNTNNRVLVFAMNTDGTFIDRIPDNILGQPNFYTTTAATQQNGMSAPRYMTLDSANNRLFVTDNSNNRVLVFDIAAITNGENAANLLGQTSFTVATAATTQNGLNDPQGLAFDSTNNRLFVSQSTANRVTVYDVASISNGQNAVNLLGQTSYTVATAATTQPGMNVPQDAAYDSANTRLFVPQNTGNRVTVYDVASITDGENATGVLGQPLFTSATANVTQNGISGARGAVYDSGNNRLFIADDLGNRVLAYDVATVTNGENATNVLGQSAFNTSTAATQQNGMSTPRGLAYDSTNNRLFVADQTNNRIGVYAVSTISNGQNSVDLLGQYDESNYINPVPLYNKATANNIPYRLGLNALTYLAYDGTGRRLFVGDSGNNRVLVYAMNSDGTFVDRIPDNVLGQPNYYTITALTQQNGLNVPQGLAYDSGNNRLFVAQSTANRVTVYDVTSITDGENATNILGKSVYNVATAATTQNGMNVPQGIAYDSTNNRLYVAQSTARRVTVYEVTAITAGENALNVLGQPNYTAVTAVVQQNTMYIAPSGVAIDTAGQKLYVAQTSRRSVLVYDVSSITNGENASNVLGQPNFLASAAANTQNGMGLPQGLAFDGSSRKILYVADSGYSRITIYDVTAITNGENAISVLGQTDYTGSTASTQQNGLSAPQGLAFDSTNSRLFVADKTNNRILSYDLGVSSGENAAYVLGQPNFTSAAATVTQNGMSSPQYIGGSGSQLFVAESAANRVTVYDTSTILNGENATNVLGQPDYTTSTAANTQNGMNSPQGIFVDNVGSAKRLFVAQSGNHRVTFYDVAAITNGENATSVLGQPNFTANASAATMNGLQSPYGVAFFPNTQQLFIADNGNNRVVEQKLGATDGANAMDLLGQYDGTSYAAPVPIYTKGGYNDGPNKFGFNQVGTLAYDTAGQRLFIADSYNNRVLIYAMNANGTFVDHLPDNVLGQPSFYTNTAATQQNGMSLVRGVAYDSTNNRLFVSESSNTRITVYDTNTITDGENATNVLGPPNFTSTAYGLSQSRMATPYGMAYDNANNRLFSADYTNNRVLVFNVAAITDGENATNVLGQTLYGVSTAATTQNGMSSPYDLSYDSTNNRLFSLEYTNNRVMVYEVTAITNGENAVNVLGQTAFTTSTAATSQPGMSSPMGVVYDSPNTRLFVSTYASHRVTAYDVSTIANGENATNVLGQATYTASSSFVQQNSIYYPTGLAYDSINNRLFVGGEQFSNRILVFDVSSIDIGENAVDLLGQYDGTSYTDPVPLYTKSGLNSANDGSNKFGFYFYNNYTGGMGLAVDNTHHRLFVTDGQNNRVLVYALNTDGSFADRLPDNVLGQSTYFENTGAYGLQNKLNIPSGVAYDSIRDRLFVADKNSFRVSVFDTTSITNGENATNMLGIPADSGVTQNKMTYVTGLAYDSTNNRLFVADPNANRVTIYDVTAITDGELAIGVLGQSNYTDATARTVQTGLSGPSGVSIDEVGNILYVADATNNRVMVFNLIQGTTAVAVLGQPNFTASTQSVNTQNGMSGPPDLVYDSRGNRLFVSNVYNRITVYNVATITNGQNATNVLGQPNFVRFTAGTTQNGLSVPRALALGSEGTRLFVADMSNNRVLVYPIGMANGQNATSVLGQPNFTASTAAVTQNGMNAPRGLSLSGTTLFVADAGNHRVLFYDIASITNGENASNLLGHYDETSFTAPVPIYSDKYANNGPNKFGLSGATLLSIDGTNHRIFIADSSNNRVLVYALAADNTFSDRVPDNILGQPNYYGRGAATTQNGMSDPRGMNFDTTNNRLFVAEGGNSRIIVYDVTAITNGENATNVLGQPNYSASATATTQNGMNTPRGLAYDSAGTRLFAADNQNNRVLTYDVAAITNGENAVNVLGQADYATATAADTQVGMRGPQGILYDSGRSRLFVAQNGSHRVTAYDVTAIVDGESATNILGQGTYTSTASSNVQNGLNDPRGLAFDSFNNRLFVASNGSNRVTVFSTTTMLDGQNADNIIGQSTYSNAYGAVTQNGLNGPVGLAFEGTNRRLFMTDNTNNRLMIYDGSGSSITPSVGGAAAILNNPFFFFGW